VRMFVGLDWASAEHAVCVVDERGGVRAQFTAVHSATGLAGLVAQLQRFGEPATLPIALERPTGLLVDTLVDAGFPVYPVHPNVVKASRARYRAAASKSDPHDAYVLADLLRTDGHRLRPLRPQRDATCALRPRSEEHTSELQSRGHLVCRLLLEKKKREGRDESA